MYQRYFKKLIDIILSLVLLIISSPFLIIVFVLLLIGNNGKVFFTQSRPGKDEKLFKVIKFKTMSDKTDSDGNLLPDEDRLTPVGSFVRKTSLDEIPQLFNILKGDMSLIGPRPWLVEYLPLYNDFQRRRHEVRPGITGWAQVNGRNLMGWEDRFKHDIYYVDNVSLGLDLKIVWMTVWNILTAKGISGDGHVTMKKFEGIQPSPPNPLKGEPSTQLISRNAGGTSPLGNRGVEEADMHYGAHPTTHENAKFLRNNQTQTEQMLWLKLRNNQLGVKFRRQHPVGNYVLDFYCHKYKLAIEIDGEYHSEIEQKDYDRLRDQNLNELGIKTLRFTNDQILNDLDSVIENIKSEIAARVAPSGGQGVTKEI